MLNLIILVITTSKKFNKTSLFSGIKIIELNITTSNLIISIGRTFSRHFLKCYFLLFLHLQPITHKYFREPHIIQTFIRKVKHFQLIFYPNSHNLFIFSKCAHNHMVLSEPEASRISQSVLDIQP